MTPCPVCGICGATHRHPCRLLARHLHHMQMVGRRPSGILARERALQRTARALAPVALADATRADLMVWREQLTVAGGTTRTYISHLRSFFDWMQTEEIRPDNPAARLPVPARTSGLPRPIATASLMRALESAPTRIRLMLVLAAWAGLRSCEVAGLLRESIRETATPPMLIVTREASKGGHRERIVPLSPFVLAELEQADLPPAGYVFPRRDGREGPIAPWLVSHLVANYLHSLGLADTAHSLRHFFGTQTYMASRDLLAVRDLLGHQDVSTTQIYAAFSNQAAIDAVNALPTPPRLKLAD